MHEPSSKGRAARFAFTMTLCLVLLLVAGALTARYVVLDLPAEVARRTTAHLAEAARNIAQEVADAFQARPRVTVDTRTIVEQQSSVLKLVTLEKTVTVRRRLDDTWLQSTKTLEVECDFTVQAGFDLAEPFVIALEDNGETLRVTLPRARLLAVNLRDVRFMRDEDGFWNKLTPADREEALHVLKRKVEQDAIQSGLPAAAREAAEKRLSDLLSAGGRTVVFTRQEKP